MNACKILIVEDESLVAMDMVDMLKRIGYNVLPNAFGFQDAITIIEEHHPDLVLVDINLSGLKTGVDLAIELKEKYKTPFIFITSHSDKQTVQAASSTLPSGYLVKPFDAEDLFTSIEVALANYYAVGVAQKNRDRGIKMEDSIFVKTDKNFIKIKISEIHCIESEHNYLYIFSEKGKHIVRSNFREILEKLPSEGFFQIHKSFIINLHAVEAFTHTDVIIKGREIPLSRNYKDDFMARINKVI